MNKDIIKNNLIIWKALNKINPIRYPSPINDGRGLCLEKSHTFLGMRTLESEDYQYFHNDWNYLMEALLLIKKESLVKSFDCSLIDLIFWSNELIKDLPETLWYLENDNSEYISKDYKLKYDLLTALENDIIPITNNIIFALSFELRFEADEYLSKNFQARHLYRSFFKITEH